EGEALRPRGDGRRQRRAVSGAGPYVARPRGVRLRSESRSRPVDGRPHPAHGDRRDAVLDGAGRSRRRALREPLLAGAGHGGRVRPQGNGSGDPRRNRQPHGLAVGRHHPRHHRGGGVDLPSHGLSRRLRPGRAGRDPPLPAVGAVRKRMKLGIVMLVLLAALPVAVRSDFVLTIFIFTFIYGILAVTFDLIFGFTGQLSMFHPAVFGVSAYATPLLVTHAGLPFWLATLPSAAAAVFLAIIVGSICFKFRLKTFYFAVVTLAFAEMIRLIVLNWN